MKEIVFDTETTGLPLWGQPSEDPGQPHLVQLAALLVDTDTREVVSSMDVIVKPDGWEISEDIAKIHGITTERAREVGVPETVALAMFMAMWNQRPRIAHNCPFDDRIIRIALHRYGEPQAADIWKAGTSHCTQSMATSILNVSRRAAGEKSKTANLREAYQHFTGKELVGAHNAMNDALACLKVYFAIQDLQLAAAAPSGASLTQGQLS